MKIKELFEKMAKGQAGQSALILVLAIVGVVVLVLWLLGR